MLVSRPGAVRFLWGVLWVVFLLSVLKSSPAQELTHEVVAGSPLAGQMGTRLLHTKPGYILHRIRIARNARL